MILLGMTLAATAATLSGVSAGSVGKGTLAGRTTIDRGCPGPSTPGCNPWHAFPDAKILIVRTSATGTPLPHTARTISSNSKSRFSIRLAPGAYRVTPLAQTSSTGGRTVLARVRSGGTTTMVVRFDASKKRV